MAAIKMQFAAPADASVKHEVLNLVASSRESYVYICLATVTILNVHSC